MQVKLVVTGDLEKLALPRLLKRWLPGHTFIPQQLNGFTSARLRPLSGVPSRLQTAVSKLAAALVAAVYPGKRGERVDHAVLVDDLEVDNLQLASLAIDQVRAAVVNHIQTAFAQKNEQAKVMQLVKEKCSFHLFVPMTETYLFGDLSALRRVGVSHWPQLACAHLEDFRTDDTGYLAGVGRPVPHAQHPKRYLAYLVGLASALYRETHEGVAGLESLDLNSLLPALRDSYFCSFLYDVADAAGNAALAQLVLNRMQRATWVPGTGPLRNL